MKDSDLGPLPKIHPREAACDKAELELRTLLLEWQKKHESALTYGETVRAVHRVTSGFFDTFTRGWIRQERHGPNADKNGDIE